ncbi:MAG: NAD-dependent epimerase/dehydratase family protein [Burkholderiales bacterium]|nr:NAD-dependent epimerase/dehydratase family protein [Burkholderiales bacterium]
MRVLVTGAGGFVGAALARRLQDDAGALGAPVTELILADMAFAGAAPGPRAVHRVGSIADDTFLDSLVRASPDVVFHLASIPGGAAERDPALGTAVNLHATTRLLEQLAGLTASAGRRPPVVVFTSTVAVYGAQLPAIVDDATPLRPVMSYGAHKLMTEYHLADLSRRGLLDGRSVRLPGIVARPAQAGGHVSAFMSNIFHALAAGEHFTCPVSAAATCWWMSRERCVDNLLHIARMPAPAQRTWPMPVLRLSIGELVDALARIYGEDRRALVRYEPVEAVESVFGRQPPLDDRLPRALGLRDDGDVEGLIRRALA